MELLRVCGVVETKHRRMLWVLVEMNSGSDQLTCIYRPESKVYFPACNLFEAKSELYRDVCFSRIAHIVGASELVVPVWPWSFKSGDNGVLRQYWPEISNLETYQLIAEIKNNPAKWIKLAALDYVCAVYDRVANDVLITPDGVKIIDSGLAFLKGYDFDRHIQHSIFRETLKGEQLDENTVASLVKLLETDLNNLVGEYLDGDEIMWIVKRINKILTAGVVL